MRALLLLVMLTACSSAQGRVGGKTPVNCTRGIVHDKHYDSDWWSCRDADRQIWICNAENSYSCIRLQDVEYVWKQQAEASP